MQTDRDRGRETNRQRQSRQTDKRRGREVQRQWKSKVDRDRERMIDTEG